MWLRRDRHAGRSASGDTCAKGKCSRKADGGATCRDFSPGWKRYVSNRDLAEVFQRKRREGPHAHLPRPVQCQQGEQRQWELEVDHEGRWVLQRVQQAPEGLICRRAWCPAARRGLQGVSRTQPPPTRLPSHHFAGRVKSCGLLARDLERSWGIAAVGQSDLGSCWGYPCWHWPNEERIARRPVGAAARAQLEPRRKCTQYQYYEDEFGGDYFRREIGM